MRGFKPTLFTRRHRKHGFKDQVMDPEVLTQAIPERGNEVRNSLIVQNPHHILNPIDTLRKTAFEEFIIETSKNQNFSSGGTILKSVNECSITSPRPRAVFLEILTDGRDLMKGRKNIMPNSPTKNTNFGQHLQLPDGSPEKAVRTIANLFKNKPGVC
ncbi:hypothetical protein PVK06_023044 [Gossypium arboreum]|uniref:Uncharacterized protein n=1 Tax=Gossypium arboreum TaxID=29729 RepID=A0ABR0PA44_GOSAR|nr:hypothetical protein PVK06_023044 [Gossypium arboreum]